MLRTATLFALLALVVVGAGAQSVTNTTKSGVKYTELKAGTGEEASRGKVVYVHYTGWLYVDGARSRQIDTSTGHDPLRLRLGSHEVIAGLEDGLEGMKVGGRRELIIPPNLAYGAENIENGLIPPFSTLEFEVELVKIEIR
jgi:peptidylprolyl isomerase